MTVVAVSVTATALLALSWAQWPADFEPSAPLGGALGFGFWVVLTLLASAFPVRVPRGTLVSVSTAPILASTLLGGPTAGALVALLGTFELRELRREVPWYGVVYNHLVFVLATVPAGAAYLGVAAGHPLGSPQGLAGAVAAGSIFILINVALAAVVTSILESRTFVATAVHELKAFGPAWAGLTPIAWLMALAYLLVGPLVAPVLALPLYTTRAAYKAVVDMRELFTQTVRALASAIDARDPSTRLHSEHVSDIAVAVGREMKLGDDELDQLEWGGLLHDIGKIGIRDAVLLKPDRLTRDERILMNEHPVLGEEILKDVDQLERERPLIRHHHEWYNGSGYPDRLVGEEIPLLARVLHVADAFEAMTASRPYRPVPLGSVEALAELRRYAGIQFDPTIVDAFARTKYAVEPDEEDPGSTERSGSSVSAVPAIGQVAAGRVKSPMPTTHTAPSES